jgi:integrase
MANINRLTAMQVDTLPSGLHADGGNLYLQVKELGSRSWLFRYRIGDKQREAGLGKAGKGHVVLKDARLRAAEGRAMLNAKPQVDPLSVWRPAPMITALPFAECAAKHIERQTSRGLLGRNVRHQTQWRSTLMSLPAWFQETPVDKIGPQQVYDALDPIWSATPETGMRLRGRIEAVIDSARSPDDMAANPAAWTGWLKMKLGSAKKLGKIDRVTGERVDRAHFAAMDYRDLPAFIAQLRTMGDIPARALEFTILNASRTGEVLGAQWPEINLERRTWEISWRRLKTGAKTKKNHIVPLSARAIAILEEMAEIRNSDFVFPGRFLGGQLGHATLWLVVRRRMGLPVTVHAFRSSFRDWAGDCSGASRETAEAVLGHVVGGVEGAYRRMDAFSKRRQLMEDWAAYCEPSPESGTGNVVRLEQRSSRLAI